MNIWSCLYWIRPLLPWSFPASATWEHFSWQYWGLKLILLSYCSLNHSVCMWLCKLHQAWTFVNFSCSYTNLNCISKAYALVFFMSLICWNQYGINFHWAPLDSIIPFLIYGFYSSKNIQLRWGYQHGSLYWPTEATVLKRLGMSLIELSVVYFQVTCAGLLCGPWRILGLGVQRNILRKTRAECSFRSQMAVPFLTNYGRVFGPKNILSALLRTIRAAIWLMVSPRPS